MSSVEQRPTHHINPESTITNEGMWASLYERAARVEAKIAASDPVLFQKAQAQVIARLTGQTPEPHPLEQIQGAVDDKLAGTVIKLSTAAAVLNFPKKLPRRHFLKLSGAAPVALALGNETEENSENLYLRALGAEGMAWNLLMQVNELFGSKTADLIAHAFYHTNDITFEVGKQMTGKRRNDLFQESALMFERLADSMLKLGAVKALNKILEEKEMTYSWNEIREVINAIVKTPGQDGLPSQPLEKMKDYFLDSEAGFGMRTWETLNDTKSWAWRLITPKGVNIYEGTTTMKDSFLFSLINGGEIVMARRVITSRGEDWWETMAQENIKPDQVRLPGWIRDPKTVFTPVNSEEIIPTYS